MKPQDAANLARRLDERNHEVRVFIEGDRIAFAGATGGHDLDIACSSEERVVAHWEGFCECQPGARRAEVAKQVAWLNGRHHARGVTVCIEGTWVVFRAGTTVESVPLPPPESLDTGHKLCLFYKLLNNTIDSLHGSV
jgi:hypothetical protein